MKNNKDNHVIVVRNDEGDVGIYVNGNLIKTVDCAAVSTISVNRPDSIKEFPILFDECVLWNPIKMENCNE